MDLHETFNDSYARVTSNADYFFEQFYQNFTAESEEIQNHFRHVDMVHQIQMLEDSLAFLISFATTKKTDQYLIKLAGIHNHSLKVSESMYEIWMQSLIQTVRQVDLNYNHDVEMAWYEMLSPGVEFMKHYERQ